jgi:hypothetical protein
MASRGGGFRRPSACAARARWDGFPVLRPSSSSGMSRRSLLCSTTLRTIDWGRSVSPCPNGVPTSAKRGGKVSSTGAWPTRPTAALWRVSGSGSARPARNAGTQVSGAALSFLSAQPISTRAGAFVSATAAAVSEGTMAGAASSNFSSASATRRRTRGSGSRRAWSRGSTASGSFRSPSVSAARIRTSGSLLSRMSRSARSARWRGVSDGPSSRMAQPATTRTTPASASRTSVARGKARQGLMAWARALRSGPGRPAPRRTPRAGHPRRGRDSSCGPCRAASRPGGSSPSCRRRT